MGLTIKISSREAYTAFSKSSLQKLHWFITLPLHLGVFNILIHTLIGIYETGFYLHSISTKYGRNHTTCRIHHPSHYTQTQENLNVILAVEGGNNILPPAVNGSIFHPRR